MIAHWLGRHRRSVLLAFVLFAVAGVVSVRQLPVGLFPLVDFPRIVVKVDAGDRPVDRMIVEVTRPLEQTLRAVPGVMTLRSDSTRGSADVSLSFAWGTDMVTALLQTQAVVNAAVADLPPGTRFSIRRMDPTVFPVLGYSVTSRTQSLAELRDLATYRIGPELSSVDGVAQVEVLGGSQSEYQVLLDPLRLQSMGLAASDVAQALSAGNVVTAVGRLEDHDRLYLALSDTRPRSLDDLRHTIVRSGIDGGVVALSDVAEVRLGALPEWTRVNADGADAVLVNILQQRRASTVSLAADMRQRLKDIAGSLPRGVAITPYYDQSELIVAAAGSVRDAILIGAALAGVILLVFLRNWRMTLIVSLVLPMVLLSTCVLLNALGQSFNIMTLGGMAAAVGLIVDDAVVVLEHIARRLADSASAVHSNGDAELQRDDAMAFGSAAAAEPLSGPASRASPSSGSPPILAWATEMLRPLAGSSAATIAVFLPLALLGGVAGAFFRPLALTMATTLAVSFLVALLVVPVLARAWLRPSDATALERSGPWQRTLQQRSSGALERTLQRPALLIVPLLVLAGAGGFAYLRIGSGFMPHMDEGGFIFDYRSAPGTSLTETDRLMRQVETIVRSLPEVASYSRRTGIQLGGGLTEANEGDMFIKLKPLPRRHIEDVMSELRQRVQQTVPGLDVETALLMEDIIGDLTSTPQPIEVKVYGADDASLRLDAKRIADAIGKIDGVVEVRDGTVIAGDAVDIHVDPIRAGLEGMTADGVTTQLGALLDGVVTGQIQSGEKMVGVRLWTGETLRARVEQVSKLPLRSPTGAVLPLARVADIVVARGQAQQQRENLRNMVAVTARLEGRDLGSAIGDVQKSIADLKLPPQVVVEYGGIYHEQQQSFRELALVFCAALLLVATVLMLLYERISVVLAILSTVLLTLPGAFVGLWLTGSELDLSSMMGLTMVVGIVTEVAVFYFAEIDTRQAVETADLRRAAAVRLRPILMTSSIAILALMPLALGLGAGSEMQRPLAITIISGLVFAVPMVLLVMPVLFRMLDRRSKQAAPVA